MTKQLTFFNESQEPRSHAQRCKKFGDYEAFTAKFKPKKTTDDCYTPPAVYAAVLDWIRTRVDLTGRQILRPFYPGGDFEHAEYPPGCVVIDNPPFSIFRQIVKFYLDREIKFFLFAPGLTCFLSGLDICCVVIRSALRYTNGATVPTAFATNLLSWRVVLSGSLERAIKVAQAQPDKKQRRIVLPDTILTPGRCRAYVPEDATDLQISSDDGTRDFFDLKRGKWKAFGGCLRIPEGMAERLRAERLRAERLRTYNPFDDSALDTPDGAS